MNGVGSSFGQPAQWQEHRTEDGRVYYYNAATKVTQWTKPEDMMTAAEVRSMDSLVHHTTGELTLAIARSGEPAMEGIHG